jgi:hypothetical protein
MKKIFKQGDITLTVKSYKYGIVEVHRGKELIFLGENPTMLLNIHSVLTQLAIELNKNEEKKSPKKSKPKNKKN